MYKFKVSHTLPMTVFEIRPSDLSARYIALVISVEFPPDFSRKYDDRVSHRPGSSKWNARDAWYRTVDILYDFDIAKSLPARLNNTTSLINIGRWTTYKLVFNLERNDPGTVSQFLDALHDFNIPVKSCPSFNFLNEEIPSVFDFIDSRASYQKEVTSFADELLNSRVSLHFEVRYQLEVCISQGCLDPFNISRKFVEKLSKIEVERAKEVLASVALRKRRIFKPMAIFDDMRVRKPRRKLPEYAFYAHTATVTPTTIYFGTPTMEISNRVIRHLAENADRFLRVRFTDEKPKGNIYGTDNETLNEVFTRVKRVLMNGIVIGDRHYQFLAFGNSQFREHGAYFFCPPPHLNTARIRKWMGNFRDIKTVAKYAARLGQCFSTTRAIHGARATIRELDDVTSENGKFTFTDGVGIISKFLAQVAATEIGVLTPNGDPPSAMQFRLGGCKGVLVVWPLASKRELYIRKSQHKFNAEHEGLEIIRWSQFSSAHLNRQLVTILTTLGVEDEVFLDKLDKQLYDLSEAMDNPLTAVKMLQKEIDPNQMTLEVAEMVNNRFQLAREPFMMSLLGLWRAWSIKYLKEKAKLAIEDGAVLLGCIDESGKLEGHRDHLQSKIRQEHDINALPQIFLQISTGLKGEGKLKIIEGVVILARNPSLHPGDIRIVKAVDVPELHHLRDVVVLPKTGDRDLAGMCSGGDLDGDDFLVLWDKDLIPREWNLEPMDYTPPPPLPVEHEITVDDLTSFFVQYMKNDTLGNIAMAHLATADDAPLAAKDPRCIELAQLHSKAVDYAKSGHAAQMPPSLKPRRWPHFMERRSLKYHSKTALGKLYDRVELVNFMPSYDMPFDARILEAYSLKDSILKAAANIKEEYDAAVRRIMAQHDIATDFEVWSTFVLHHAKQKKDFKFHEEIGQLAITLKDTFRDRCYAHVGGREYEKIAPFVAAMYTVTSRQVSEAVKSLEMRGQLSDPQMVKQMPMMSFPWIFSTILGEIATGRRKVQNSEFRIVVTEQQSSAKKESQQAQIEAAKEVEEDTLQTPYGVTHRGDTLKLFSSEKSEISQAEDVINPNKSAETDSSDEDNSTSTADDYKSVFYEDVPDLNKGEETPGIKSEAEGSDELEERSEDEEEVILPVGNKTSLLTSLAKMNDVDE